MAASGLVVVAVVALALVPAAFNSSTPNGLIAYVVQTSRGPLPPCSDSGVDCTAANQVWNFIHVVNLNQLKSDGTFRSRDTLSNAFVVSSVNSTLSVNGSPVGGVLTSVPPPNLTDFFVSAGRWPSTVTCGQPPVTPCTVVGSPAVIPGENTVILYAGWTHTTSELKGRHVFTFTVHGTLNGTPVDLTASSLPIVMT